MGNLTAHYNIMAHVMRQLTILDDKPNYLYLELGNFLTDLSQFRDPYAYLGTKPRLLREVLAEFPLPIIGLPLTYLGISRWRDELLGKKKTKRGQEQEREKAYDSFLARFFTRFALAFTHMLFANDSPIFNILNSGQLSGVSNLPNIQPLEPDEVDRQFKFAFTQYYPHEHLDLPPYREGPEHRSHRLYQRHPSGLVGYIEEQIQYVSEQLTKIESQLMTISRNNTTHPLRHFNLVLLGHTLHAIEDYFFHSNYLEIYQCNRVKERHPDIDFKSDEGKKALLFRAIDEVPVTDTSGTPRNRVTRRFARRLRYPVFEYNRESHSSRFRYSPTTSEESVDMIYTGGFATKEMYHTIHSALEGIERYLRAVAQVPIPQHLPPGDVERLQRTRAAANAVLNTDLVLFRAMFNEEYRNRMADEERYGKKEVEKYRESQVELHAKQLTEGKYYEAINSWRQQGYINDRASVELKAAFREDETLEKRYHVLPGVGGILVILFAKVQDEFNKSERRARELDSDDRSITDKGSDNRASAELIGSHTLMAKDSSDKEPLVAETRALAQFASTSIATILVTRLQIDPDPENGLDWDSILRHYLRFPKISRGSWESTVLDVLSRSGNVPDFQDVNDKPEFRPLGPDFGAIKLNQLRKGKKRRELESRYHMLEDKVSELTD